MYNDKRDRITEEIEVLSNVWTRRLVKRRESIYILLPVRGAQYSWWSRQNNSKKKKIKQRKRQKKIPCQYKRRNKMETIKAQMKLIHFHCLSFCLSAAVRYYKQNPIDSLPSSTASPVKRHFFFCFVFFGKLYGSQQQQQQQHLHNRLTVINY